MRKVCVSIFLMLFLIFPFIMADYAYAQDDQIEGDLSAHVDNQLDAMDFGELDGILINFTGEQTNLFGASSFSERVKDIISGKLSANFTTFWGYITSALFDYILAYLPLLSGIIAISILCSFFAHSGLSDKTKDIGNIVFFACFSVIVGLTSAELLSIMKMTSSSIALIKKQIDVIFPILITMMTAVGSVATSTTFQPLMGLFAGGIINIFMSVIMPMFVFSFIFVVVGNLTSNVRLDKFNKFIMSLFKWLVGGVFTMFMGFVAVKGITASSIDNVSIKTAKFALRSYVPILGGYLSEGFNLIVASSVLIKNAVGATGLVLLMITMLSPVIKIMVLSLSLKLVSAIIEPITDSKISNFIYSASNTLTILFVSLIAVGFMYLIIVGMMMCCGNVL